VPLHADPVALLRRHGVQVTAQRIAVLRAVHARPHGTADELTEVVRAEIGAISRQAVYDSLGVLVERGLLRRIEPAGSATRYEHRVDDNHHHLVCRVCGVIVDVDCDTGEAPCLDLPDPHGFDVEEAEVIYWGRCPTCAAGDGIPANRKPDSPTEEERA
jgi:Fur family transcriptional regulator, stress-responsive regulator